jgi:bifunctional DNA-binding transcriptional regulator/antitoxin component of YhaV-PrlF toxin-antitoxin module
MTRPPTREHLIGVLLPPTLPQDPPSPAPLATLPIATRPSGTGNVLFDVARLDSSGRLSTRAVVRALGWRAGQRLDVVAVGGRMVVTASATGRHTVTGRGEVSVPAATRALSGIGPDESVLLTADTTRGLLVVHPAASMARLLADLHTGLPGGKRVG